MKLQVTQENLTRALGTVARIASSRGSLPVLANVLLQTSGNRLSLAATNLDIGITQFVGAKIAKEGSVTVPARLMQDFVGSLPPGVISLELEDNKLHIATEQYKSLINGIAAEDFPVMPKIDGGKTWQIGGPALKKGLQQVAFAASSDESRPVLTGVLLRVSGGTLHMAATDSYRLAERKLSKLAEEVDLLVPASAMQECQRVVSDVSGEVRVTHDDQQVRFEAGDVELVARLIDGQYPPYEKLIPSEFAVRATLARADLQNVTKVSSLFARESAGSVTIDVDEDEQLLSIHSIASQLGENTASSAAEVTGSGKITLNSRYILDALNALSGDKVQFSFNGKLEATLLRDPDSDDYLHIIMPLKS